MFLHLRELILKNAARFRSENEATLLEVNEFWDEIAKELGFRKNVGPHSFKDGVLIISCSSSVESSSLNLVKEKIKEKVNSKLKNFNIKEIRFRVVSQNR